MLVIRASLSAPLHAAAAQEGYLLSDRKCLPCPMESGRSAVSHYLCHGDHKLYKGSNFLKSYPIYRSKKMPFACEAIPNNHRRNPDFSRQRKGSSKGRSRQYQEQENYENVEESVLPSKNGPLHSLSNNQRYQATATPGHREKEIVELFRKVQAQLRARAAAKEEKKMEVLQEEQGEKGTVDSLLKLLRKHSVDQHKKDDENASNDLDQLETNNPFKEEQKSTNLPFEEEEKPDLSETSNASEEVSPLETVTVGRPVSNFRRKSPVPRVKFQPILSVDEDDISIPSVESQWKKQPVVKEQDVEPEPLDESGEELLDDPSDSQSIYVENDLPASESPDLSSLKLSELRSLAKSRSMKGYSKLKKSELVELLSGDGPC